PFRQGSDCRLRRLPSGSVSVPPWRKRPECRSPPAGRLFPATACCPGAWLPAASWHAAQEGDISAPSDRRSPHLPSSSAAENIDDALAGTAEEASLCLGSSFHHW